MRVLTVAGEFHLDFPGGCANFGPRRVALSPTEISLLLALATDPGVPVDRLTLAARLDLASPRSVDVLVSRLRDQLGDGVIRTVYGIGYALETAPPPGAGRAISGA